MRAHALPSETAIWTAPLAGVRGGFDDSGAGGRVEPQPTRSTATASFIGGDLRLVGPGYFRGARPVALARMTAPPSRTDARPADQQMLISDQQSSSPRRDGSRRCAPRWRHRRCTTRVSAAWAQLASISCTCADRCHIVSVKESS
jgi:hypothetical protein